MSYDRTDLVAALRAEATRLAGRPSDLVQRASVYHHLFQHSGGNHAFPLLAAHGALWASGYFRSGIRLGIWLARAEGLVRDGMDDRIAMLHRLAEAFREINRQVCVETSVIYHLTGRNTFAQKAEQIVPPALLDAMARCHHARRAGRSLDDRDRKRLFHAFFLWEQAQIVGPAVDRAFAAFGWRIVKAAALRPRIDFAYFGLSGPLRFRDFSDTNERIDKGLAAFDRGASTGWGEVARSLGDYGIMPAGILADPARHVRSIARGASAVAMMA
ncbi:hypothetical protein HZF05_02960 [Sphingomonas sp. CGMCC 1.13654]|uniref:Uncharacterized protein n=1 Tax=Sphingomonas chungangi TaxID=2683589 RepID=A0A838L2A4_9SPHN|nr:hypothetical protein [Sphingomonas chungangi]MBA2933050.1 hypothetical protein [Sphingomonas chungangi]MVW56670.1 hypothetical protein [Sphingomonas chungangi]